MYLAKTMTATPYSISLWTIIMIMTEIEITHISNFRQIRRDFLVCFVVNECTQSRLQRSNNQSIYLLLELQSSPVGKPVLPAAIASF